MMLNEDRINILNHTAIAKGKYVLYWMQQAQRTRYNHALEFAVLKANELGLPLVVCFVVTDNFPDANLRHYSFMLEGIKEIIPELKERNIKFVLRIGDIVKNVVNLSRNSAFLVSDRGYLQIQRDWRKQVAEEVKCPFYLIESDVIVPVDSASQKEEYAARTIRPKINRKLDDFIEILEENICSFNYDTLKIEGLNNFEIDELLDKLNIDKSVPKVILFKGGYSEAKVHLESFIKERLNNYHKLSNDPAQPNLSNLSPYIHFGQISPVEIAIEVIHAETNDEGRKAFLEQLIVRRELSLNFVYFNDGYNKYNNAIPEWAQLTLDKHSADKRPYLYSIKELENAQTHDIYWNATQKEMLITGKMHGYMRMYWGKKVIEWSPTPQEAFDRLIYLNNKYEIDGRDPNGFTGIAWCFGKHDHPWKERPVFGKVRYMNARGLERKFKMDVYLQMINDLD